MNKQHVFLDNLKKLNQAQGKAVRRIEGPVFVNSGAGSGKTHVIAMRIGYILSRTDVSPFNILCLTFTESGVVAMRNRLIEYFGAVGHDVHIYTFHAFCNAIIQSNPFLTKQANAEPATEVDTTRIIIELFKELDVEHPLNKMYRDSYYYEPHLKTLFSLMKMEGWSYEKVQFACKDWINQLPTLPEFQYKRKFKQFQAGDPKEGEIAKETERVEKLIYAAQLFERYNDKLRENMLYDYGDMISIVINAFKKYSNLLLRYQEQYQYMLVDEFQDTNGSQLEVIKLLASYWSEPNLIAVGDDDQSVFEFQGARIENAKDLQQFVKDPFIVNMTKNYRCGKEILDTAHKVISKNKVRVDKRLIAGTDIESTVELVRYSNLDQELADIFSIIKSHFHRWNVAIIYSKHKQAEKLIRAFSAAGIPFNAARRLNAYYTFEGQFIMTLFEYFCSLPKSDLAKRNLFSLSLYEFTGEEKGRGAMEELAKRIAPLYHTFPLSEMVVRAYDITGLMTYVSNHQDRRLKLLILNTFLDFVKDFEVKNPDATLFDMFMVMSDMKSRHIALPVEDVVSHDRGVNMLTAHAAKGLEFQEVYMLDCTDNWLPSKYAHTKKFKIPPTLTFSGSESSIEASRRAFYVAMTRAKKKLQVSYSKSDKDKERVRCQFVDETELDYKHKKVDNDKVLEFLEYTATPPVKIEVDDQAFEEWFDDFNLSPSAMSDYLECPFGFYCKYVLKAPFVDEPHFKYGKAIHHALQETLFSLRMQKIDDTLIFKSTLVKSFKDYMEAHRGTFSRGDYQRYLLKGKTALEEYYDAQEEFSPHVRVEQTLTKLNIEGVPVKAIIDKLTFTSVVDCEIVDYKTGKYDSKKFAPPSPTLPYGSRYWQQGQFYYKALQNYTREDWMPTGMTFDLVEDKRLVQIQVTKDSQKFITNLITSTYEKIKNKEFDGCGECEWCKTVQ